MPLEDVVDPYTGEVLVATNEEIDEDRSAYRRGGHRPGQDPVRAHLPDETHVPPLLRSPTSRAAMHANIGEAVRMFMAAQSIGEPGTALTMRTFHIGRIGQVRTEQIDPGASERRRRASRELSDGPEAGLPGGHEPSRRAGAHGRRGPRYQLTYGAKLLVEDGQKVPARRSSRSGIRSRCQYLTEAGGVVKYGDIIDSVTMQEQLDEVAYSARGDHRVEGRRYPAANLSQGQ